MSFLSCLCIFFAEWINSTAATTACDNILCTASQDPIETQEYDEGSHAQLKLLQVGLKPHMKLTNSSDIGAPAARSVGSLGGDHRYLVVRPCARFAGDGMSGLPRHRVTGECCGDSFCSSANFEKFENCPQDCKEVAAVDESQKNRTTAVLPPTETSLFGILQGMEHDDYHCSDDGEYQVSCSKDRNYSVWLDSLLDRAKNGTLPFDLPPPGSIAVEFGCGKGQDSRNMAGLAGYALTAVDVSPSAIEIAKNTTQPEMMGSGPGQIEYVAYDAMAIPAPKQRVDFFFDATVYCSLRHEYLARFYEVWSRLFTPGHTLVHIQCWNWELQPEHGRPVPRSRRDMEADFEPFFDILHSEDCTKNQDGPGWCFYMKAKAPEVREATSEDRLKMQQAVRNGDIEYVRQNLGDRSGKVSDAELRTLYYIAQANRHVPLMQYLTSISPEKDDPFFQAAYGRDADPATVEEEDRLDGSDSFAARMELKYMKADWERAEAALILQTRLDRVMESTGVVY